MRAKGGRGWGPRSRSARVERVALGMHQQTCARAGARVPSILRHTEYFSLMTFSTSAVHPVNGCDLRPWPPPSS